MSGGPTIHSFPKRTRALLTGTDVFALVSIVAAILFLPFARIAGPELPGITTVYCGTVILSEPATAFLLLFRFRQTRKPVFLWLAGAYLYAGALAVLMLLTFPDALAHGKSLLSTSRQSTPWVFHLWIWGFSLIVVAAVVSEIRRKDQRVPNALVGRATVLMLASVSVIVSIIAVCVLVFPDQLPLLIQGRNWTALNYAMIIGFLFVLGGTIIAIRLYLYPTQEIFRWLELALITLFVANVITSWAGARYSLGWSVGRLYWMVSASAVFIYFLGQFCRQQESLAQSQDHLEQEIAERAVELSKNMALLKAISEGTSDLLYAKDRESRIVFANPAMERTVGAPLSKLIGNTGLSSRKLNHTEVKAYLVSDRRVMETGQAETIEETFTGTGGTRTYLSTMAPMRDTAGRVIGLIGVRRDITERKEAENRTQLLLREVSHRAKNLLAVAQGIVRSSAKGADPKTFADHLAQRLAGLATSHDLLVKSEWRGVGLTELVAAQLAHVKELIGNRIDIAGANLTISPGAAQTIGMAIHELATNASKYGALSNDRGKIAIRWELTRTNGEVPHFKMSWMERGGPPAQEPNRRGYGHSVIVRMVEHALDAKVSLNYSAEGIEWNVSAQDQSILDRDA
jgi:PAS domain S-box-containing protein